MKKCSIIFMRKVERRLNELEEQLKELKPKERATEINKQLLRDFCVGRSEMFEWKKLIRLLQQNPPGWTEMENLPPPKHLMEIAKMPEEKQKEVIEEVKSKNLSKEQTILLVQEKLGKKKLDLQLYNVWKTFVLNEGYGQVYPGRTPHQIIQNLLYYYTKEGDLVVDPMAGGGTVVDVCKEMNRECMAFDLAPARKEILQNDILKEIPTKEADFIFLDPPYYTAKEGYVSSLFTESIEGFYEAMMKAIQNCWVSLKKGGVLAILLKPLGSHENGEFQWYDLTLETFKITQKVGFKVIKRICVPLSTQQYSNLDVHRAKENRYMLNTLRDLVVYQK